MNDGIIEREWIIFLNSKGRLSSSYFALSQQLAQGGEEALSLLPMNYEQVRDVLKTTPGKINLILSTCSLDEKINFEKNLRRFLSFGIRSGRLKVFHLSSFERTDLGLTTGLKGNYFFFKLPISIIDLCDKIKAYRDEVKIKELSWPGGRRAPLPRDVGNR